MATTRRRLAARTTTLGVSVAACLTPLVALAPSASAASLCGPPADTVPPQVTSLALSTTSIDLASKNRTVTITAGGTDSSANGAASGIDTIEVDFSGPRGGGGGAGNLKLASGTTADGTWTGHVTVPKYTPAGSFSVAQVTVVDHNGNATYYDDYGSTPSDPYSIALQSGWQTKVTLTGKGPTRPAKKESGKLASFHFSPTTIDATRGAKKVRLVATFTGRQPHSVFASFQGFNDGDGGIDSDGTFKRHGHTWTGRMTVSQWIGNHTYRPDLEVDYTSRTKPFHRTYSPDLLAARFATTTLKVKSSIDGTPPALTGLSITPSSVNTVSGAETLTVKATAVDPKSGVRSINASFSTNDGNVTGGAASGSYPYAGVGYSTDGDVNVHFTHTKGNTWTGKALFHSCEPNGKWHINVDVEDHARNDRNYSPGRLAKAKLPSTLQVTSTPGDIVAPYIYGSTSSSQDGTITLDFSEGVKNVTTTDLTVYPESPAKTRYRMPDPISSITCSNGHATVDCSGTGGLITSAVLAVPALSGQVGTKYEVWTNLGSTSSQLTDGTGNPMDWTSDVAEVTDS